MLPLGRLPLVEALNGACPRAHNERAALVGRAAGMAPVGGSDATRWRTSRAPSPTVRAPARRQEFLDGLRRGLTLPAGRSGSYARLTSEVIRIFAAGYAEVGAELARRSAAPLRLAASALLLPFLPLIPLFTLAVHAHEVAFAAQQFRALCDTAPLPPAARGGSLAALEEAA